MNNGLKGKVALVTGSARGMGAAVARRLAESGASIAAVDIGGSRKDGFGTNEQLEDVVSDIRVMKSDAISLFADLTIEDQVKSIIGQTMDKFGKIDILVNCVGFIRFGLLHEMELEVWKKIFDINTHAHFLTCKHVVPIIKEQGWGRIINISSNGGLRGIPEYSAYCAAKFAVIGFTQALANEVGGYNVTVNAVCPGGTATEFLDNQAKFLGITVKELKEAVVSRNIIKELIEPEDVANAIDWLCTESARFVTGTSFLIEGGSLVKWS